MSSSLLSAAQQPATGDLPSRLTQGSAGFTGSRIFTVLRSGAFPGSAASLVWAQLWALDSLWNEPGHRTIPVCSDKKEEAPPPHPPQTPDLLRLGWVVGQEGAGGGWDRMALLGTLHFPGLGALFSGVTESLDSCAPLPRDKNVFWGHGSWGLMGPMSPTLPHWGLPEKPWQSPVAPAQDVPSHALSRLVAYGQAGDLGA